MRLLVNQDYRHFRFQDSLHIQVPVVKMVPPDPELTIRNSLKKQKSLYKILTPGIKTPI